MAFCDKCGKELRPGAKFCEMCGATVSKEKPVVQAANEPSEIQEVKEPSEIPAANEPSEKTERGNKGLTIAIIVALLAICIATPLIFWRNIKVLRDYKYRTSAPAGMAYIPPGQFMMGCTWEKSECVADGDKESPVKKYITKGFYIDTHEVTQAEYKRVAGANPSGFFNCGDQCPVESVSFEDAVNYCEKIGKRLPKEAEWIYATRAGTTSRYYWGEKLSDAYAWHEGNSGNATHPVGQKKPNSFGLYDMLGNVWEFVQDCHDNYPLLANMAEKDPVNLTASCKEHLARGGSWSGSSNFLKLNWNAIVNVPQNFLGFRCAMDLDGTVKAAEGGQTTTVAGARAQEPAAPVSKIYGEWLADSGSIVELNQTSSNGAASGGTLIVYDLDHLVEKERHSFRFVSENAIEAIMARGEGKLRLSYIPISDIVTIEAANSSGTYEKVGEMKRATDAAISALKDSAPTKDQKYFTSCLDTLSAVKVAEEMYIIDNNAYAGNSGVLAMYMTATCTDPRGEGAGCVDGSGMNLVESRVANNCDPSWRIDVTSGSFVIYGIAKDSNHCHICVGSSGYRPQSFSDCAAYSNEFPADCPQL